MPYEKSELEQGRDEKEEREETTKKEDTKG